jgi:2-keto-4-pentenoate hydratase/2-oxohepta-3-ene-1,7-dioic acid hydratase in catechol pathway
MTSDGVAAIMLERASAERMETVHGRCCASKQHSDPTAAGDGSRRCASRLSAAKGGEGMLVGSADGRVARRNGSAVELLDLPYASLGEALVAGVTAGELRDAPVLQRTPFESVRLGAPVPSPGAVWAAGLSYREHTAEAGKHAAIDPGDVGPALFLKASSSVIGDREQIVLPALAPDMVDYEGEVAVVIGRRAGAVAARDGWDYVFGLTAANDVSARDVQEGIFFGGVPDPSKAKSFDTFTPLGPWVATPDEFEDREDIGLRTLVNGEVRQQARTSMLIHPIPAIVAAVSRFATLRPGDVILTGTPAGVGLARGQYLVDGDEVRVEVDVVGALRNHVTRQPA